MPHDSELMKEDWRDKRRKMFARGRSMGKSDAQIDREYRSRLGQYKASLVLGREFGESSDSFLQREGLVSFWEWDGLS